HALSATLAHIANERRGQPGDNSVERTPMHDVLIVGAGSSGATLAARLSENASIQVLLVEAGRDYRSAEAPLEMRIPNPNVLVTHEQFDEFQWTNVQAARTAAQEPHLYWRGKGMGGSSAINGQIAIRALPEDHDSWVQQGCTGWGYDDVLPDL